MKTLKFIYDNQTGTLTQLSSLEEITSRDFTTGLITLSNGNTYKSGSHTFYEADLSQSIVDFLLWDAVKENNEVAVTNLLAQDLFRVSGNVQSMHNESPMDIAAKNENKAIIMLLVNHGVATPKNFEQLMQSNKETIKPEQSVVNEESIELQVSDNTELTVELVKQDTVESVENHPTLVVWGYARQRTHDISGIENPEKYKYRKENGIFFPVILVA